MLSQRWTLDKEATLRGGFSDRRAKSSITGLLPVGMPQLQKKNKFAAVRWRGRTFPPPCRGGEGAGWGAAGASSTPFLLLQLDPPLPRGGSGGGGDGGGGITTPASEENTNRRCKSAVAVDAAVALRPKSRRHATPLLQL